MLARLSAHHLLRAAACSAAVLLVACSSDDTVAARQPAAGSFTVDATSRFVYVSLADSATVTPAPSATESAAWDLALFATNITLNGGQAGPGGVTGYCVCQNSAVNPTNEQWLAMTPASEAADFDAVTTVPAGATFAGEVLTPAIGGWYGGAGATAVARTDSVYFVRLSDSSGVAKVRVTAIAGATAAHAGTVTLEYAVATNGTETFGEVETLQLDLATGPKSVDLQSGQVTSSATDWDLRFDGWTARVNGGVSGPGKGAATRVASTTFAAATPASTNANAYRIDSYAGVFGTSRFYKYNIGGDNRITPTFDVYLLKRGSAVYKLQVTGYYNATGQGRHITFRYAQIAG